MDRPAPSVSLTPASRMKARWLSSVVLVACANGVSTPSQTADPADPAQIRAPNAIAFVDVRLVTMTDDRIVDHQTVIIRDGRIERILASTEAPLPPEAIVIQGAGRYLAPALIDMHVHLRRGDLPAYLRAGIGTVRNMWGHSGIPSIMREIDERTRLGPQVYSTGPGLDGTPPQWPETRLVLNAGDADSVVQRVVDQGWRVMKVYQNLDATVYDAIMDAVRRRGLSAVGHVPTAVPVETAIARGQRSIEHLTGYDRAVSRQQRIGTWAWIDVDEGKFTSLAQVTVAAGTWNCPTLAIFAKLSEQHTSSERTAILTNRHRFIRELARHGAHLLAGSDAGFDVVAPGTSLHDELRELVTAGLTPYEAMRTATIHAAQFLKVPGLGTIVAGAPAQLILLDANPLADIANVQRLAGLVLRGEWFSAAALRDLSPP